MSTKINVDSDTLYRLKNHLQKGEVVEDVIIKLLDLDDKYSSSPKLAEFEVSFDEDTIKVFKINDNQIEYFTPARDFSISLADWNLPDEFRNDWINFITSEDIINVLLSLGDDEIHCGCFIVRQI